jgi:hypothetical protein
MPEPTRDRQLGSAVGAVAVGLPHCLLNLLLFFLRGCVGLPNLTTQAHEVDLQIAAAFHLLNTVVGGEVVAGLALLLLGVLTRRLEKSTRLETVSRGLGGGLLLGAVLAGILPRALQSACYLYLNGANPNNH